MNPRPVRTMLCLALAAIPCGTSFGLMPPDAGPLEIQEAVALAIRQSPQVAKAISSVEVARGKSLQSSLHPNPTVTINGDELGDRTGSSGIWTPKIEQEFVGGKKRRLKMTVADREVCKAEIGVQAERMTLRGEVESRYLDAIAAVKRVEILTRAVGGAEKAAEMIKRRVAAKESGRLEVVLVESQAEKYMAELESARAEAVDCLHRLALLIGESNLKGRPLGFDWDAKLPDIDLESLQQVVCESHPEVASARLDFQQAQTMLDSAKAEQIPNLTLSTGYTRQNQNRSSDWLIGVSAPIPAWNRNQGNIKSARGAVSEAGHEIARIQLVLADKVGSAHRDYASARKKAEYYRNRVLPKVQEVYDLSIKAYQGGQLDFDKLFDAERVIIESHLEHLKATIEAWKAAHVLSSLSSSL